MISDGELLAACRGGKGHWMASRLYRQACDEWRERNEAIRQAEAERAVFLMLHDTAQAVWPAMMRERSWREAA